MDGLLENVLAFARLGAPRRRRRARAVPRRAAGGDRARACRARRGDRLRAGQRRALPADREQLAYALAQRARRRSRARCRAQDAVRVDAGVGGVVRVDFDDRDGTAERLRRARGSGARGRSRRSRRSCRSRSRSRARSSSATAAHSPCTRGPTAAQRSRYGWAASSSAGRRMEDDVEESGEADQTGADRRRRARSPRVAAHAAEGHATSPSPSAPAPRRSSQLAAGPFDVVLLDIVMPGIDGLQLLEEIRGRHPPCPSSCSPPPRR